MSIRTFLVLAAVALVAANRPLPAAAPAAATVPFLLDHNRLTVDVEFPTAAGTVHTARAWVDTGGTNLVLAEPLARAVGADLSALSKAVENSVETATPAPAIRIGGMSLDTEGLKVFLRAGRVALPGVQAECILPARCLRHLHVVFDYPARRLTIAPPGSLKPVGSSVPCKVNATTGLFMVDGMMDGERVALGVDTGSAGTWVSDTLTTAWLARHPDWPKAVGAAGSTNFFGFPFETQGTLLRVPTIAIGPATTSDVAVLGLPARLFQWYSQKSAGAVAGFVGADLLARFRLEVDFPAQTCWWQPGPARAPRDLDIVGLTVRPETDGSFTVAGVVSRAGTPVVAGIEKGDKLLRVGGLDTTNARMGDVIEALRGRPGETRHLLLERAGRRITVDATVVRLP